MTSLACPFGDATFLTVGPLLVHVAEHLTQGIAADSAAAQIIKAWQASPAARASSGKSQEILMRLLAVGLQNAATAANARQMVLNRDPTLKALEETASTATAALIESDAEHQAIRQWLLEIDVELARLWDELHAIQLTPGAAGAPGQPRFVGSGPPPDPLPGATPGDYYLDRVSGDLYQLGST